MLGEWTKKVRAWGTQPTSCGPRKSLPEGANSVMLGNMKGGLWGVHAKNGGIKTLAEKKQKNGSLKHGIVRKRNLIRGA